MGMRIFYFRYGVLKVQDKNNNEEIISYSNNYYNSYYFSVLGIIVV